MTSAWLQQKWYIIEDMNPHWVYFKRWDHGWFAKQVLLNRAEQVLIYFIRVSLHMAIKPMENSNEMDAQPNAFIFPNCKKKKWN